MIPGDPKLLHIYDATDFSIDLTASVRNFSFSIPGLNPWGNRIHQVPVSDGISGLRQALDELVKRNLTFSRALFETHGQSGAIFFAGQRIDGETWRNYFSGRGYERIFPYLRCHIYFNGCNVADDPNGWDFLDAAGSVFLKRCGGVVFAQTGLGRVIILTGHVYHFSASTKYSVWLPGGFFLGHNVKY
jgi:hypothetical protein